MRKIHATAAASVYTIPENALDFVADHQNNKSPASGRSITRVTQSVTFSGPLPPPSLLAQYNDVIPDGANRIMAMAERQSAHREALETKVVNANVTSQARGSFYGFALCLVTILGGFYLIATGKSIYGIAAIIGSLATLAGVFVIARREQRRERVEKSTAIAQRRPKKSK